MLVRCSRHLLRSQLFALICWGARRPRNSTEKIKIKKINSKRERKGKEEKRRRRRKTKKRKKRKERRGKEKKKTHHRAAIDHPVRSRPPPIPPCRAAPETIEQNAGIKSDSPFYPPYQTNRWVCKLSDVVHGRAARRRSRGEGIDPPVSGRPIAPNKVPRPSSCR